MDWIRSARQVSRALSTRSQVPVETLGKPSRISHAAGGAALARDACVLQENGLSEFRGIEKALRSQVPIGIADFRVCRFFCHHSYVSTPG